MLFPLSYCFPDDLILDYIPDKEKMFALTIPNANFLDPCSYTYTDANEYLKEYRRSTFGITHKKNGWDCYRHLEIMSQGCFPYFQDIDLIPKHTMMHYPKEFMKEMMNKYGMKTINNIKKNSMSELRTDIDTLLKVTRENLSGTSMLKYILNVSKNQDSKNILYASNWEGRYIGPNLCIAGKKLFGKQFVDRYPSNCLYKDYPEDKVKDLYGRGFNYSRLIPSSQRTSLSSEEIKEKISSREFDCIFYGTCIEEKAEDILFIQQYYEPHELIYICESDCSPLNDPVLGWTVHDRHYCPLSFPIDNNSYVFMREIG